MVQVVVVSDLHISVEADQEADQLLDSFFAYAATGRSTLVLAGDTFDFLLPEDGAEILAPFDAEGACQRLHAIAKARPFFFEALAQAASSPNVELVILAGNHDVELAYPQVWDAFVDLLAKRHPPARQIRRHVLGEPLFLRMGSANVVVEHGDELDDWNRIDHASLLKDLHAQARGLLNPDLARPKYGSPPGTLLVRDFVLPLRRAGYKWIDQIQPVQDTVIPIIWRLLDGPAAYGYARRLLFDLDLNNGILKESIVSKLRRRWSNNGIFKADKRALTRRAELGRLLSSYGAIKGAADEGKFWKKVIKRLRRVAERDRFFDVGAPDPLTYGDLAFLLWRSREVQRPIHLIVHGHTHSAKAHAVESAKGALLGFAMNAGAWTRMIELPRSEASDGDWIDFLGQLKAGGTPKTIRRPTFIRLHDAAGGTADLIDWTGETPKPLVSLALAQATCSPGARS